VKRRSRAVIGMPPRSLYSLTCEMRCIVASAEAGFGAALTNHTALYTPGHRSSPCRLAMRYRGSMHMCCFQHLLRYRATANHPSSGSPAYARERHRTQMGFGVNVVIHGHRRLQLHRRLTCSIVCEDLESQCLVLNGWESLGRGEVKTKVG
jgi:hypothetical protein